MTFPSASARSGGVFDVAAKQRRLEEIEAQSAQESFWADAARAKEVSKEKSLIEAGVNALLDAERRLGDAEALAELIAEEPSEENLRDLQSEIHAVAQAVRRMELQEMLSGPNDKADAIVCINAGAGGTEAQDWAQ